MEKVHGYTKTKHRPFGWVLSHLHSSDVWTTVGCGNEWTIYRWFWNKLLCANQALFRKNNCCESALQTVVMKWKTALPMSKETHYGGIWNWAQLRS